ncbi:MAG: type IV toxin-antitoxin system AbiEi family antitoxin domain-containing protein [Dissulfurispiraceae bacterium]
MSAKTGHFKPVKGTQNITRGPLGRAEARFLAKVGGKATFTSREAQEMLGYKGEDSIQKFLERLQHKGWIRRIRRGRFAVIPLSSGEDRTPQLHEFIVAMELVSPAAIAYWSALNHHGMTEQLPRTVFVATNHPVRRPPAEVLGVSYKIISLRPEKFFGIIKDWIGEMSFMVTDREKTIIDSLDLPAYAGGIGEISKALSTAWAQINEPKLRKYAAKIGNSAVAKRLGFLMETLDLGDSEALRKAVSLAPGFSLLDPTMPGHGRYNRRWGLLVNAGIKA